MATLCRRIFIAIVVASTLHAQDPIIRETVPVVLVPVSVTDHAGRFVTDLQESDFALYDNQQLRKIHADIPESIVAPVSIVIAVQTSGISAAALAKIRRTGSIIQPLIAGEQGEAAILQFDDRVAAVQSFTSDPGKIDIAFQRLQPGAYRSGRMIDAVTEAVRLLALRPSSQRRVLLLIGEARDRGSHDKLADAVALAQRANVIVYSATYSAYLTPFTAKPQDVPDPPDAGIDFIAIFGEIGRNAKRNAAAVFAESTGGRQLSFLTLKSLEDLLTRVGQEIHNQYLLSFTPSGETAGEYRRIHVEIKDRAGLKVRARPGYWFAADQPK